jgi:mannose-1-phosphate guanylyltransferase
MTGASLFIRMLISVTSEFDAEANDEQLRLEQDVLAPLAAAKKLYVYSMTQPWVQIKSAA